MATASTYTVADGLKVDRVPPGNMFDLYLQCGGCSLYLTRAEAVTLAADLLDAIGARSLEIAEPLPSAVEAAIARNEVSL